METEARGFIESNPCEISLEYDPQRGDYIIRGHIVRLPPVRLGVILGDYIHNLRSALDHLVWQLVLVEDNTPGKWTEFPLFSSEPNFRSKVEAPRRRGKESPLLGVGDRAFAIIKSCQPYHPPPEPGAVNILSVLHKFSNIDKHQLVHVGLVRFTDGAPKFTIKGIDTLRIGLTSGPLENGAEWGRVIVCPSDDDTDMEVSGSLPVDLRFGEQALPRRRLQTLNNAVVTVVDKLGPFAELS
ncbi:MAG: hypothetical protein M3394_01100 [Actinomycetota bacterium]|nr:hypothetical protein [Actinomycetota bacterium]